MTSRLRQFGLSILNEMLEEALRCILCGLLCGLKQGFYGSNCGEIGVRTFPSMTDDDKDPRSVQELFFNVELNAKNV